MQYLDPAKVQPNSDTVARINSLNIPRQEGKSLIKEEVDNNHLKVSIVSQNLIGNSLTQSIISCSAKYHNKLQVFAGVLPRFPVHEGHANF